jgi:formate hydrogenlyase subunit 6/NADH:ubiquinone oxidoreductase subunit I
MLPVIQVNDSKCPDPLACRRCLLACPTRVLGLGTNVAPKKYQETEPSHYIVRGVRFQACTACMKCVAICPNGAIQVTADRGVAA